MQDETIETDVESTPEEGTIQEESTTARLFPDLIGTEDSSEEVAPEPARVAEEKAAERPRNEKGQFVSETKPEPEYLSLEDFGDKKVKVKIDGVEKEVTLRELQKGYQTDQYLTQKGQKLSEDYKRLTQLKPESIQTDSKATASNEAINTDDEFYREYIAPYVEPYKKKVGTLEATLESFKGVLAPLAYENNLKMVDKSLKEKGHTDFLEYRSRIEEHIFSLPVEQQAEYDSPQGYVSIYKDLKIQDMEKKMSAPPREERPKNPDARKMPKLVNIESSGGVATKTDDSLSQLNAAVRKAQNSGRTSDWQEVIRLKYGS